MKIPTKNQVQLIDVDDEMPPKADKLLLLSKYGVLNIGTFQQGFHLAWSPLPKIPASVKEKINERYR